MDRQDPLFAEPKKKDKCFFCLVYAFIFSVPIVAFMIVNKQ